MKMPLCLSFWCYALLFVALSSESQLKLMSKIDEQDDNSTVPYQLGANTVRNYDEKDLIWYNSNENSTKDNGDMQYAHRISTTRNYHEDDDENYDDERDLILYNLNENSTKDNGDMQYAYRINSMRNYHEHDDENYGTIIVVPPSGHIRYQMRSQPELQVEAEKNYNDNQMLVESHAMSQKMFENLKRTKGKNGSTSHKSFKNFNEDNYKNNIVSYKMCENITCILLCCPFGKRLVDKKCIAGQDNFIFLQNMYKYINDSLQKENEEKNELFLLVVRDPCQKSGHYTLNPLKSVLLVNGSLYLPDNNTIVESTSYCFANVDDQFDMDGFGVYGLTVKVCFENIGIVNKTFEKINFLETELIIYICSLIGVILCLLMTFVVYSTIPELRNIHGYILRSYSGSLIVAYMVELTNTLVTRDAMGDSICIGYAFVKYYLFLGSYFWLNVMNFDMWRTFRKLRSLQRNMKQQKRKKLIMYSVFAWGGPFILAIICGIMEFVPGVPKNFLPRFNDINCWFNNEMAYLLYFFGIETISIISSICLFICMARNIAHHKKAIAHCLRDSENRSYNNNKNRFDLQLKICTVLFIVMCIKLVMVTIIIIINIITINIIYMDIIYLIISCTFSALDFIEQFGMFIIFVWKRKIKLLLLKRFGC